MSSKSTLIFRCSCWLLFLLLLLRLLRLFLLYPVVAVVAVVALTVAALTDPITLKTPEEY